MKRFIVTVLSVAVFFIGLGALVENVGAKFKSDEKALDLVRKARVAIGGDPAINGIQSLRIVGQTTRSFKVNGSDNSEQAETEIALQFPDKFMKMTKVGKDTGTGTFERSVNRQVDVVVVGDAKDAMKVMVNGEGHADRAAVAHKIIIKKDDGTTQELTGEEAAAWIAKNHPGGVGGGGVHTIMLKKNADGTVENVGPNGEHIILRKADGTGNATWTSKDGKTGEAVLLRKSDGGTTTWTTTKDGKTENLDGHTIMFDRVATGGAMAKAGGVKQNDFLRTALALLLTAPQGMDVSYTFGGEGDVDGTACNIVVAEFAGASYRLYLGKSSNLPVMMKYNGAKMPQIFFRTAAPNAGETPKDNVMFEHKLDGPIRDTAEFIVKFTDYRSVGGVQLPYKWTQTVDGAADETFDVTNYEVNPTNIAEKFQNQKVMVRTAKPTQK